jgi:hypothetical protein
MKKHNFAQGEKTPYGFMWGGVEVTRVCADKKGATLLIESYRETVEIFITPTGKIRCIPRPDLRPPPPKP